jgi:sulfur-oxidizing protein SoxX
MHAVPLMLAALLLGGAGDPARGRAIAADRTRGLCTLCHAIPGTAGPQGNLGPSLAGIGARATAGELRQRITDPRALNPATVMPAFGSTTGLVRVGAVWQGRPILSAGEIEDLVAFLQAMRE